MYPCHLVPAWGSAVGAGGVEASSVRGPPPRGADRLRGAEPGRPEATDSRSGGESSQRNGPVLEGSRGAAGGGAGVGVGAGGGGS